MNQTVIKIGNSVGIILPAGLREENGIQIGDKVSLNQGNQKGKILISTIQKKRKTPVSAKFAQMVDEFMTDHEDVLQKLAQR